ncbi:hypothetical protein SAMN02745751_01203 [Dethiosulfatibacter aminovorans DSM 17477]|uniref:Amidohydrolase 3 domain-containing protein n=1 Tax=Dethiosulfatibacter aminovorans DSM 17477 TaxID=1121476 RepID=A0A1M6EHY0_9FIRM|nr:amidohydrolase [Dethiosulfatibacter aminovorans]SHI85086.1 hypothetical protein SAMN02745751_01203 [Dethiosulfatibacter aminovorans DSM 17477]
MPTVADKIYIGKILTLDENNMYPEAVSIKDGKILEAGTLEEVFSSKGEYTEIVEIKEGVLAPAFIDAHGHFGIEVLVAGWIDIQAPPYGECSDIDSIIAKLKKEIEVKRIEPGDWVVGFGYYNDELKEKRHPNRYDLDMISKNHPIVIWHASLHFCACNSKALEMMGLDNNTENPYGGEFCRDEAGELTGVCIGTARYKVVASLPQLTMEKKIENLKKAEDLYFKYGVTTIQDGGTRPDDVALFKYAMERDVFRADIVCYPMIDRENIVENSGIPVNEYKNRVKIGGIKMVADGGFAGTVKLSKPYNVVEDGKPADYTGLMYETRENMDEFLKYGFENDIATMIHASGDACIDMVLDSYEEQSAKLNVDLNKRRDILLHYTFPRLEQADRVGRLKMFPSLLSPRVYFARQKDIDRYGEERFSRMCPSSQFVEKGMRFSLHMDAPMYPPHIMPIMHGAVNRKSIEGIDIGSEYRISALDALKAVTINAAYQYREENIKGTIEKGKMADLVILNKNPLEVEQMDIINIEVLETIKEGVTVFKA